ncbi:pyrroline-5-carboxylate reductase [Synechococcus sp. KORDI-52]|uniref:pyrroline-5-carboxylate reductase n=1 Tax=Synechococcus sp. KORDI-52 TaxID=585425 RepID=UPI0005704B40|nr:pyrroline-5-carboxylate reductase [Synechococcus sp. KORDI-52]
MQPSFGVIGLGRMAQALLTPWLEVGLLQRDQLQLSVASQASAQALSERFGCRVHTEPSDCLTASELLLALKPQQLGGLVEQLGGRMAIAAAAAERAEPPLLISVLAGVGSERLQDCFPGWRVVRTVPNTPALVRQGLVGLAFGDGVSPDQQQRVQSLFAAVGEVLELPESQLPAFLALTSSGPAFVALVAESLADGAVAAGLPRARAHHLAHRTLAGTAALLFEQELHPGELKDMVSSPAGATIAGIRVLEQSNLRSALIEAVVAAAERSRELA